MQQVNTIKVAAIEAAFIVFGVALAYGANSWRQARLDAAKTDRAMTGILAELRENRDLVQASMAYHGDLLSIIFGESPPQGRELMKVFSKGFISPAAVDDTAWETAKSTGAIAGVPYNTLLVIAKTYRSQNAYEQQSRSAGQIIYQALFDQGTDGVIGDLPHLGQLIQTFHWREKTLISVYNAAIRDLDGEGPNTAGQPID